MEQEGRNAQLKKVQVKSEQPQVGTAPAEA